MITFATRRVLLAAAIVFLALLSPMFFGWLSGTRTRYCPFGHHISDLAACAVVDEASEAVLLQHADLDSNVYYFEIRKGSTSAEFEMPESISALWPAYSAKLLKGKTDMILLNGVLTRLLPRKTAA